MDDEIPHDEQDTCLQALGTAIADSADVSGQAGSLLRRTLTDFATFATRLEEEAASSTPAQLQKTLKSLSNFCLALDGARSSLETRIQSKNSSDSSKTASDKSKNSPSDKSNNSASHDQVAKRSSSKAIKEEKPCSSKTRSSRTLKSAVDELLKEKTTESTDWMASTTFPESKGDHGRALEEKLRSIGLKQSGVEIAKMPLEEFDSLLEAKKVSPENVRAAKDIRRKLRRRFREIHERQVKKTLKSKPVAKKEAGAHLRVDYDGLLASIGLSYSYEQIGKMSLDNFNEILSEMGLDAGQASLAKMVRSRAKVKFNRGIRSREPSSDGAKPRKCAEKKKTRGRTAVVSSSSFDEALGAVFGTSAQEHPVLFQREHSMGPTSLDLLAHISKKSESSDRVAPNGSSFRTASNGTSSGAEVAPIDLSYTPLPSLPSPSFPTSLPSSSINMSSMHTPFNASVLEFDARLREAMGLDPIDPAREIKEELIDYDDVVWID